MIGFDRLTPKRVVETLDRSLGFRKSIAKIVNLASHCQTTGLHRLAKRFRLIGQLPLFPSQHVGKPNNAPNGVVAGRVQFPRPFKQLFGGFRDAPRRVVRSLVDISAAAVEVLGEALNRQARPFGSDCSSVNR